MGDEVSGRRKAKQKLQRSDSRAANEVLLLWAILAEGGGDEVSRSALDNKGMLPNDDKAAREGLEARGLIKNERRSSRNEKGRSVTGYWLSMTHAGRAWAEGNLAAVPAKSQAAAPVLQAWMKRLSVFLNTRNMPLTEFLKLHAIGNRESTTEQLARAASSESKPGSLASDYNELRARIRTAYLELTGGRLNTRCRLCDLREKLTDVERATLDETLKRMQREHEAALYPLDNKSEITQADRDAAIYFGSEPRHILWIER